MFSSLIFSKEKIFTKNEVKKVFQKKILTKLTRKLLQKCNLLWFNYLL